MKRALGWLLVIPLLLAACGQQAAQTGQPVEVTRIVEVTRVVEVTPASGAAPAQPAATPLPPRRPPHQPVSVRRSRRSRHAAN